MSSVHKDHLWASVQPGLRGLLGGEAYDNWLKPVTFCGLEGGVCELQAPSSFVKDWVMSHFRDVILAALKTRDASVQSLRLRVVSQPTNNSSESEQISLSAVEGTFAKETAASRKVIGSSLDPRLTFERFVVGKPNEFAYAAAKRVAEGPEISFNPLFLHGGVGHGKTHLMVAIAHRVRELKKGAKVIYLSAEKFMYHFIRALRFKDTVGFKEELRAADLLLIDDIQFIADKDSTQEEFFHTFNELVEQKRQVVLSADRAPSDLKGIKERVRSRLAWGLVADIHPTTYELRLGILQSRTDSKVIPKEVLEFLAQKIVSNVRELEGALNRLMAQAHLIGSKMTIELAKEVLRDVLRACDRTITVEEIQKYVGNYYNIGRKRLLSAERTKDVVYARQLAMFLAKELTTTSLPQIAKAFEKRDHTTVLHAVKKIASLIDKSAQVQEDVDLLRRMLQS